MRTRPLQWTDPAPPDDEVRYDHVTAETPFGDFLITWKSWKDDPDFTVDYTPWGPWFQSEYSLEGAKRLAWEEYRCRLLGCLDENDK